MNKTVGAELQFVQKDSSQLTCEIQGVLRSAWASTQMTPRLGRARRRPARLPRAVIERWSKERSGEDEKTRSL